MELSNHLNLLYEEVDTQVLIVTENLLLALDFCALFEVKLIKRSPAWWKADAIKYDIKKKYIFLIGKYEYKSVVDDSAKIQKETKYKQHKIIAGKHFKKSNMKYYHEALRTQEI